MGYVRVDDNGRSALDGARIIGRMTERGLPSMDGAPACPFVAFGDDRDGRSTSPDHRHRCFAESPPAPRALAHQEAYCLSSAFPVCPTFQDWARREAAHARGGGERAETAPTAVPSAPATTTHDPGADDDSVPHQSPDAQRPPESAGASGDEPPVRRNPPRDWAAPPPWATGTGAASRPGTAGAPPDVASEFLAAKAIEGQGLAGSPADRLAGGPPPASTGATGSGSAAAAAGAIGGAAAVAAGGWSASAAGSSATPPDDDLAGLVQPRTPGGPPVPPTRPAADSYPPSTLTGRRPAVSSTRPSGDAIPGPSWERMRRYEAYPTIKTRAGLPGLPRVAVLVGALGVAALALFMLPALLGFGGGGSTSSASPSASTPRASTSVAPTVKPGPTPHVYVIQKNDTLSKIAKRFGLTLDELLAANKDTITNPDRIAIGDQIVIPVPGTVVSAAPSGAPSGSAAP